MRRVNYDRISHMAADPVAGAHPASRSLHAGDRLGTYHDGRTGCVGRPMTEEADFLQIKAIDHLHFCGQPKQAMYYWWKGFGFKPVAYWGWRRATASLRPTCWSPARFVSSSLRPTIRRDGGSPHAARRRREGRRWRGRRRAGLACDDRARREKRLGADGGGRREGCSGMRASTPRRDGPHVRGPQRVHRPPALRYRALAFEADPPGWWRSITSSAT